MLKIVCPGRRGRTGALEGWSLLRIRIKNDGCCLESGFPAEIEDMHVAIWTIMKYACNSAEQRMIPSNDTRHVIQLFPLTDRYTSNPGEQHAG
jgi:hypothetical protein